MEINVQQHKNHLIRLIVLLISLLFLMIIPFDTLFTKNQTICIHYHLLGFQCPLCGLTRAVHQFMHFHFASALNYNVVVAMLPLYLLIDIATYFLKRNWLWQMKKLVFVLIIVSLLALYAFRIANHFNWV